MKATYWCVLCLAAMSATAIAAVDKIRVANEGQIRDAWMLQAGSTLVVPKHPSPPENRQDEACVSLGYLIREDGTTSDFALLKSWSSADVPRRSNDRYWAPFAQASADAVSQWRFQPLPDVASEPVYTVATLLFGASSPELRQRCAIPSLVSHIVELQQDRVAFRQMNASGVFDELDLNRPPPPEVRKMQGLRGY